MTDRQDTRDENDTADEQRGEEALIAAAAAILRGLNPDVPHDFVAALFSHAEPEDLMHFDPRALASLAGQAWSLLAVRTVGAPRIRLAPPSPALGPRARRDDWPSKCLRAGSRRMRSRLNCWRVISTCPTCRIPM